MQISCDLCPSKRIHFIQCKCEDRLKMWRWMFLTTLPVNCFPPEWCWCYWREVRTRGEVGLGAKHFHLQPRQKSTRTATRFNPPTTPNNDILLPTFELPIRIKMSSSAPRGTERTIHQDYIARIRYSNALPPPPNPPKLLDIPNTGLASGQYTTPGFASRLARDQPLNIEADAELGMPLDLVGMPGIFDGDESCKLPILFALYINSYFLDSYPSTITSPGAPSPWPTSPSIFSDSGKA